MVFSFNLKYDFNPMKNIMCGLSQCTIMNILSTLNTTPNKGEFQEEMNKVNSTLIRYTIQRKFLDYMDICFRFIDCII